MNAVALKQKMKERGLDARALAEKTGLSESYIKLVTRGLTPARHTTRLLALVLGCPLSDLIDEQERGNASA